MKHRRDKINYYLDIAGTVCKRSTCLRKKYGAILVKNDEIISSGFNGAPRGRDNCCDLDFCIREQLDVPRGERYELCRAVHAEANCIISAARHQMLGSSLYLACHDAASDLLISGMEPCAMCKRLIINAGISTVFIRETETDYRTIVVEKWIETDDSIHGRDTY